MSRLSRVLRGAAPPPRGGRTSAPAESGASAGQIIVLFALMLTALFGILGLSIDVGYALAQKRSMQNAADLGAIAGAHAIAEFRQSAPVKALDAVENVVGGNRTGEGAPRIEECSYIDVNFSWVGSCGEQVPELATGVRLHTEETHDTFFIHVVPGAPSEVTTAAHATAQVEFLDVAGVDSPYVICGYDAKLAPGEADSDGVNDGEMNILANDGAVDERAIGKEFRIVGRNTARPDGGDKDGDGLADEDEGDNRSDIDDADSDNGGVSDGAEVAVGSNPNDAGDDDSDGDGLPNVRETDLGINAGDPDSDDGGMSDGDELRFGLDPSNPADDDRDSDGGGLTDRDELALSLRTGDPGDDDGDTDDGGLYDYAELDLGLDPLNPADDDGDTDDGGLPDLVELDLGLDPGDARDDDGDIDDGGLPDLNEAALALDPYDARDDDGDTDDGGLIDVVEVADGRDTLDPADDDLGYAGNDRDGDGLTNAEEAAEGTDPRQADTDNGGAADGLEVDEGEDPLDDEDDEDLIEDEGDGDGLSRTLERAAGTDRNNADTDGGGVADGAEVTRVMDPLDGSDDDGDSDDGGVSDATELAMGLNPDDPSDDDGDTDDGGIKDFTELARGSDPFDAGDDDRDRDDGGIVDFTEEARDTNRDDPGDDPRDSDGGGMSDFTELARGADGEDGGGTNPADAGDDDLDTDDGGVIDSDEDALGTDSGNLADDDRDTDDGGVTDAAESATGTDQGDASDDNGDGDVDADGDNDIDGEGDDAFTGAEEVEIGSDPGRADTDGDGFGDGVEIAGGTDPLVAELDEIANCGLTIPEAELSFYRQYNTNANRAWLGYAWNQGAANPNNDGRKPGEVWNGRKGRSSPSTQRFTVDGIDGCYGSNQNQNPDGYPAVNANNFSGDIDGNCILLIPVFSDEGNSGISPTCPNSNGNPACELYVVKVLAFRVARHDRQNVTARLIDDYPTFGGTYVKPGGEGAWGRDAGGVIVVKLKDDPFV